MLRDKQHEASSAILLLGERLMENLRAQLRMHDQLIADLEQKQHALRAADMQAIFDISQREQQVSQQLSRLEQQRQQLLEDACRAGVLLPDAKGLQDVARALPDEANQALRLLAQTLESRIKEARGLSGIVRAAAEALNQHIGGVVQSLRKAMSDIGVYERQGRIAVGRQVTCAVDVRS